MEYGTLKRDFRIQKSARTGERSVDMGDYLPRSGCDIVGGGESSFLHFVVVVDKAAEDRNCVIAVFFLVSRCSFSIAGCFRSRSW